LNQVLKMKLLYLNTVENGIQTLRNQWSKHWTWEQEALFPTKQVLNKRLSYKLKHIFWHWCIQDPGEWAVLGLKYSNQKVIEDIFFSISILWSNLLGGFIRNDLDCGIIQDFHTIRLTSSWILHRLDVAVHFNCSLLPGLAVGHFRSAIEFGQKCIT